MKLVFIDPKCPTPYDGQVLLNRGLGGTEATVVRIAQALSRHHEVTVIQHNRKEAFAENASLEYLPSDRVLKAVKDADHVVFIQKAQNISQIAGNTKARLWLWLHNYLKDEVPFFWQDHLRYRLGIICVSQTHAQHTLRHMRSLPMYWASLSWLGRGGVCYLHNPIDDSLQPDPSIERDPFKLVFFSSPYKGIEHVLAMFRAAYERDSRLKLYVADPGYIRNFDAATLDAPGIIKLGSLPQREVLRHVRESMCVFYPQRKRPETFGLVYAEANAVGTPVLAHDFGAAREVLCDSNPPIDASRPEQVLRTLAEWINSGAPQTTRRAEFSLTEVARQWEQFLQAPDAFRRSQRLA